MSHPIGKAASPSGQQVRAPQATPGDFEQKGKTRSRRSERSEGPSFRDVLESTAARMASGERMMDRALRAPRGGELSYEKMLALQAGVYRYTREVELAGKLVERSTSALKQTIQSQQ